MASELRITTLANNAGTESVDTTYVINGSAKSWISFTGTGTITIRDSFSVSSIVDNTTGDYSINFSNAMDNNDYSHVTAIGSTGSTNQSCSTWSNQTTSQTQVHTRDVYINSPSDGPIVSSTIHGDLA